MGRPSDCSNSSLTSSLVESSKGPFESATKSPFLVAAGRGILSREKLSQWLSQDRLYAQTYISFIGGLLAQVQLPITHVPPKNQDQSPHWRIAHILQSCLNNIFRELQLFEDVAQKYELDLEARQAEEFAPAEATADYTRLFQSFTCPIRKDEKDENSLQVLLPGLVVLWATEKCYLHAWQFAAKHLDASKDPSQDADGGALRRVMIPNWTSDAFTDFVHDLENLVNTLANEMSPHVQSDIQSRCGSLWYEVLDIERRFWPEV